MKVLFLTHHFLDKNGGGSFASRAYINAFAEIADELTLLYPDDGHSVSEYINSKVKLIPVKNRNTNLGKLIDVYSGRIHRYTNIFYNTLKEVEPDYVVFDNSRTSAGLIKKIRQSNTKVITIHHNYEMEYYLGSPPHWTYKKAFLYYMKKTEHEAVKYSNLNITLTDEDIDLLRKNYDQYKESNFFKIGCFEYKEDKKNNQIGKKDIKNSNVTFVISGNLSAYQTEASLTSFLEDYYPILNREYPDSKLIIAGRNPGIKLKEICSSFNSIQVIPNPIDMNEIIARGHIYICPVNLGGGLKLRVMDGLKIGLPILTHKISARGYEEFRKADCLFEYDQKESFKKALNKVVEKHKKNEKIAEDIKLIFSNNFSFKSGLSRVQEMLKHIN